MKTSLLALLFLLGLSSQVPGQTPAKDIDDSWQGTLDAGGTKLRPDLNHLFVQDTDGFPGNYVKLPPPVMMRTDAVGMIVDWLAQRLR
jgi:hypothetical protein